MTPTRRIRILYGTAAFLYWVGLYIYVPSLPVYAASRTEDVALIGIALSMYGLWQAVVRIPLGIAADSLGRRKPLLILGFVLVALGAWMLGAAGDANDLIVGRAITGLAAGTWVPLIVAFSASYPPRMVVRATAQLSIVAALGRVLATSVSGPLIEWGGYRTAFISAMAAAALATVAVIPAREPRHPSQRPSVRAVGHLVARRDVLLPSLLNAVAHYAIWTTSFGFIPLLAERLGASTVYLGLMITVNQVLRTAGNLVTMFIVRYIGSRSLAILSFVLLSAGVAGAALATNLVVLMATQIGIGFAQGIGGPVLMGLSIRDVADTERTTAMGIHQSTYAIGMFAGPWLSGTLAGAIGLRPMFGLTALTCLALGLLGAHALTSRDFNSKKVSTQK